MSFKYFALVVTLFASTSAQAFSKSELIPLAKADAQIFVDRQYTPREVDIGFTNALFEPKVGCYLGAYIDFDNTLTNPVRDQNGTKHFLPHNFEKAVQKSHAMYFFYLGYGRKLPMNWVKELARQNKFVHIALEPNGVLE